VKIVCLIDYLGGGGAQRQLCMLAVMLKRQGMDVSMLTYHPHDFFLPMLRAEGIECRCVEADSIRRRVFALRRVLRRGKQDAVLAFLGPPSLYAELAAIPRRCWGLVVSERSAVAGSHVQRRYRWLRKFHRLADYVTTNTHTNRLMIERSVPGLRGRVVTVYNAVDLEAFSPAPAALAAEPRCLRIAVAAKFRVLKNPLGFIQAIAIAQARSPSLDLRVDWYGRLPTASGAEFTRADRDAHDAVRQFMREHGLEDRIVFRPPVASVVDVYRRADAVALPSFFEGLPNVVCEAMACGRPVLMSNVCDAGNLVTDGDNGLLFDPTSPEDMARAIVEFAALGAAERETMGRKSREMAERMFDPATVAARYTEILCAAAARRRVSVEHWTADVPESAYRSSGSTGPTASLADKGPAQR
jgi:glycosyltransferase involved in cell wall biosynthesis